MRLFLCSLIVIITFISAAQAQIGRGPEDLLYLHDHRDEYDPIYQRTLAEIVALSASGEKIEQKYWTKLRGAYPFTTWYNPTGESVIAEMEDLLQNADGADNRVEKESKIIDFMTLARMHVANLDVLDHTIKVLKNRALMGDVGFFENARLALIHSLLREGDGQSKSTAYVVVTIGEEIVLLQYWDLVLLETQLIKTADHYIHRHIVQNLETGMVEEFFVNVSMPIGFQKMAEKRRTNPFYMSPEQRKQFGRF